MLATMRRSTFALFFLLTCGGMEPEDVSTSNTTSASSWSLNFSLPRPVAPTTPAPVAQEDPYAEWADWCEPVEYDVVCETAADCAKVEVPAIHHPLKCLHPWWSSDESVKVCAPGYARRDERRWRYDRLRLLVREQYFGEAELCEADVPVHKQGWRCQRAWKRGEALTKFLWTIYKRETTGRPWKRHRLNPDLSANLQAWVRRAPHYGWEVELACANGKKRCRKSERVVRDFWATSEDANPHYGARERWQYGLGAFGQNAALWVEVWDPKAPPELLCREVPAVETYLRRARHAVRVMKSGVDCDGDGKKEHFKEPTWVELHAAVSGGQICPGRRSAAQDDKFRRRLKKEGADPEEVVTLEKLGRPIEVENQNKRLAQLEGMLQSVLPAPRGKTWH